MSSMPSCCEKQHVLELQRLVAVGGAARSKRPSHDASSRLGDPTGRLPVVPSTGLTGQAATLSLGRRSLQVHVRFAQEMVDKP
jgi:hypothetical protein